MKRRCQIAPKMLLSRIFRRSLPYPLLLALILLAAGISSATFADECQGASNPIPADGSGAVLMVWWPHCMLLDYTPCDEAVSHTGYFSDNEQDVIDRDPAHCLGNPNCPEYNDTAFILGCDYPGTPEFARAPLPVARTYYWCVDTWDGEQDTPGPTWSFTVIDNQAWGPSPEDGEECVLTNGTMTWNLGDLDTTTFTLSYNVYIGTDEAAVAGVTTGDTATPMYMGNVATESYEYTDLEIEAEHFWRVDTVLRMTRPPFTPTYYTGDIWSFTTDHCCIGGILREWWTGIPGRTIIDLVGVDPNYPDNPAGSEILSVFEGPTDWDDDYGTRLHGWLHVTRTGEYTFWIATDEEGELWLSTDENPANASLIAYVTGWVPPRDFDGNAGVPGPGQMSAPIHLEAGNMYYISGLMKEGGGPDNIAVAWQGPDTGGIRQIISGRYLIPFMPVTASNPDPPDRSVYLPFDVTLTWTAGIDESTDSYYATQHVYVGNDPNAVAAATTASPEYMGAPTGPNEYGPLSLGDSDYIYWRVDGVSAGTGTVLYPGPVWRFESVCCVCPPWEAGLKLRLKFEDNAFDSSGHGNDGIEIGGPTYVPGADGQAIHLDGIDDYVDIQHPVGISGDQPRTVAAWVKAATTAIVPWTNVFGFTGPGADGTHFDIEVVGDTNSTTAGYYGLNLYGEQYDIMPVDLEWHHLAATFDGTTAYFYADAVLLGFADPAVTVNTHDNVHVGRRDDNDNYFGGSIDDVRIYDIAKNEPHIAQISMINPRIPWTWTPYPWNGAVDVPPGQTTLSWRPGACAADVNGSVVCYGEDLSAVTNRTAPSAAVSGSFFTLPMPLDLGRTFYWVVDAVNGPCTWPGNVWTFTTANWLSIDDMESYVHWTDPHGPHIFVVWRDGWDYFSGNQTGSVVAENTDPLYVLGGAQSMKYDFDNDGWGWWPPCPEPVPKALYSKIDAQTVDLPSGIGSDWTADGVRALSIPFRGQTGNATTEPFWVQLQDSSGYGEKVFYGAYPGESLEDFNDPNWHEWNIDLADFAVDLNDVVGVVIAIGNEDSNTPGGSGTIYIDDIRLYIPRCVPTRSSPAFAALDYAPEGDRDCVIDYHELAIIARDWLQTADPPSNSNPNINFKDYAELLTNWLENENWPF